jgi:hypothetical protein
MINTKVQAIGEAVLESQSTEDSEHNMDREDNLREDAVSGIASDISEDHGDITGDRSAVTTDQDYSVINDVHVDANEAYEDLASDIVNVLDKAIDDPPIENQTTSEAQEINRYNLRKRNHTWKNRYGEDYVLHAHVLLSNLSSKKAIKLYGNEAEQSILSELTQLHNKKVWTPVKKSDVNKNKLIRSLMFVKRKRDGNLKSR